jgi:hypothetical protein
MHPPAASATAKNKRRWQALIMLLALVLLVQSAYRFSAALNVQLADTMHQRLRATPNASDLAAATGAIHRAASSDQHNPNIGELETTLALLNARAAGESATAANAALLPRYRELVALRPRWPYARANLVTAKLRAAQFDTELDQETQQMVALGPWEPRLQLLAADVLYGYGAQLAPSTRSALLGALDRAVRWQPHAVIERGDQRGQLPFLCARYSASSPVVRAYCAIPAAP